jgi:hypothetical protein
MADRRPDRNPEVPLTAAASEALHNNHTLEKSTISAAPLASLRRLMVTRPPLKPSGGEFMQRCHACNHQFGLIRHRWWGYHFCKKKCLNDFLAKRTLQIGRMKDWLSSSQAPAREPSQIAHQ